MTYQDLKNWLKEKDNKNKLVVVACLVLMFIVGYGAGSFEREMRRSSFPPKSNYTTSTAKKTVFPVADGAAGQGTVAGAATSTAASSCVVKGNISSGGKKIYHVVGGAFYKIVKPEQCFNTEAEALAAGFLKSSR